MSIKSRLSQIKAQVKLVNGICSYGKNYVVIGLRSLSDNAVNYQTKMVYNGIEQFQDVKYQTVKCVYCQDGLLNACEGAKRTVCRHFLADFIWANERKGHKVNFFDTFTGAFRFSNFGGKLVKLVSNEHEAWAVVSKQNSLTEASKQNGRILADGSWQSDQERQQENMRAYQRMAG